jgi:hypothetical protein
MYLGKKREIFVDKVLTGFLTIGFFRIVEEKWKSQCFPVEFKVV